MRTQWPEGSTPKRNHLHRLVPAPSANIPLFEQYLVDHSRSAPHQSAKESLGALSGCLFNHLSYINSLTMSQTKDSSFLVQMTEIDRAHDSWVDVPKERNIKTVWRAQALQLHKKGDQPGWGFGVGKFCPVITF